MSTLREQYEAAWQQKRHLRAIPFDYRPFVGPPSVVWCQEPPCGFRTPSMGRSVAVAAANYQTHRRTVHGERT